MGAGYWNEQDDVNSYSCDCANGCDGQWGYPMPPFIPQPQPAECVTSSDCNGGAICTTIASDPETDNSCNEMWVDPSAAWTCGPPCWGDTSWDQGCNMCVGASTCPYVGYPQFWDQCFCECDSDYGY